MTAMCEAYLTDFLQSNAGRAQMWTMCDFPLSEFWLSAFLALMSADLPPRVNYIFVDFENVHETDLDRIAHKPVKVILVLGEQHKKLPVALVKKLLQYASQVQLVETGRSGKNAADLVLANYIGEVRKTDPHGYIHVLSKDKDFDALISHHQDNGAFAARHASFSEIPVLMNHAERLTMLSAQLRANHSSRPKKRGTLEFQIQAVFGRVLSPAEVESAIQGLVANKILTLTDKDDVNYLLPAAKNQTTTPAAKAGALPPPTKPKSLSKPKPVTLEDREGLVLEHWRKPTSTRPRTQKTLVSFLVTHFGRQIEEAEALELIKLLSQAGHLVVNEKGAVTYHL